MQIGELGHRVFKRLRDSSIPTFAFVNGAAMGGGLEVALHCHYRTVSAGAAALALPEVAIGLVPGWGGTQLLPNLIGIAAGRAGHHPEPAHPEDAQARTGAASSGSPTPCSSRPTSWSGRSIGPPPLYGVSTRRPGRTSTATCGTACCSSPSSSSTSGCTAPCRAPTRRWSCSRWPRTRRSRTARRPRPRRSPTSSWATSRAPACTRSTWSSGGPSGRPALPTRPWPATSPRSASSAPG